jgi:hypothetical protein
MRDTCGAPNGPYYFLNTPYAGFVITEGCVFHFIGARS